MTCSSAQEPQFLCDTIRCSTRNMTENDVVIVSAVRTPIGSFMGLFSQLKAHELGSIVIKEALARANIPPSDVSEVILGQALTAAQGQNPARQASVGSGIPHSVPAHIVSMLCGSGLKAVASAYQAIKCGDSSIVVCGGQESMTQAPHASFLRGGVKMGDTSFIDTLIFDGLTDAFYDIHMGVTAENLVTKYNITREDQDAFACESQTRVQKASAAGHFKKEIVPVSVKGPARNSPSVSISKDEFPRDNISIDALSKLRPVFKKEGTVTAGNSSGINDGAAALVLMTRKEAAQRGCSVMGRIVAYAQSGCDPAIMGIGPVSAVEKVLKKVGWRKEDVDIWELNEAFAAQSLAVVRELNLDQSKVNINGGAISLGHPIGASGARILVTLLHSLQRTGGKKGIAALCIGGGMGITVAVERV